MIDLSMGLYTVHAPFCYGFLLEEFQLCLENVAYRPEAQFMFCLLRIAYWIVAQFYMLHVKDCLGYLVRVLPVEDCQMLLHIKAGEQANTACNKSLSHIGSSSVKKTLA